ncbi:MAG: helix-turn-helix domain-containing protein [Actinomycetota bacterium]
MAAKRPSQIVAEQVSRWRTRRRLTVEQLAERVTALGGRMGRVTLTKLENGGRGVSLDEALLLAAALNVPPALLFFGLEHEPRVAVVPKSVIHPDLAAQWLAGTGPLASTERLAMGTGEWYEAAASLRLYSRLHEAQDAAHKADSAIRAAEYVGDQVEIQKARKRFADRLRDLGTVLRTMRDAGLRPPKMGPEWTQMMTELGIGD